METCLCESQGCIAAVAAAALREAALCSATTTAPATPASTRPLAVGPSPRACRAARAGMNSRVASPRSQPPPVRSTWRAARSSAGLSEDDVSRRETTD